MNIRSVLIVDPKFQVRFILKNLLLMLVAFGMVFGAIKVWERYQLKQGFLLRPPANAEIAAWARQNNVRPDSAAFLQEFLRRAKVYTFFDLLWRPLVVVMMFNAFILIVANVYYSHKIIGPIYRLKNELERKCRGEDIPPVRFRKDDPFQELADVINKTLDLK